MAIQMEIKYSYAKAVYGKDFNSLNETGDWSKKRIEEEFNNFLKLPACRQFP